MDLHEFITVLIEKGVIQGYKAHKEKVRQLYHEECKGSIVKKNYWVYLMELWTLWLVNRFTKKTVFFNKDWVDYLTRRAAELKRRKALAPVERNYVTTNFCKLCTQCVHGESEFESHKISIPHNTRILYITKNLTDILSLDVKVFEANQQIKTVKKEVGQKCDLIFKFTNNNESQLNLLDLIKINSGVKEIKIAKNCFPRIVNRNETVSIPMEGMFHNSATFTLPIVAVFENLTTNTKNYLLYEMPFEITSEYSNLALEDGKAVEETVGKTEPPPICDVVEVVIPGIKPSGRKPIDPVRLPKYEFPYYMTQNLSKVMKLYPEFIKRGRPNESMNIILARQYFSITTRIQEHKYAHTLHTLLYLEENQMRQDIKQYNIFSSLTHVNKNIYALDVQGLAEARPSLLLGDSVYVKFEPDDKYTYQGIVHDINETRVLLGFHSKFKNIHSDNRKFHIEFAFNRRPLKVEHQAIDLISHHKIGKYFFPKKSIRLMPNMSQVKFANNCLNYEQRIAVLNILEEKDVPYLLFGPPGTGKTYTLVEAIYQVWKMKKDYKILVCTPSNSSANEITNRLLKYVPRTDVFRLLGSVYGVDNSMEFPDICNLDGEFPPISLLLKYRIMLTTVVTAGRLINGGLPSKHYSYVFIDESGYATEPETLIPVAGILTTKAHKGHFCGQLVLAGDPKQLGPRIHSNFVKFCGLGMSMLERLMTTCNLYARDSETGKYDTKYVTKLIKNYRSHPEILKVPNELFYDGDLVAAGNEHIGLFSGWDHLMKTDFPLLFHHVEGQDRKDKDSPSFYNIQEVEIVMDYLRKIVNRKMCNVKITQSHIGIISPYRKQVLKLKEACGRKGWKDILIGSVEQFQGKEKTVIIMSTVRSQSSKDIMNIDKKFELGFLRNAKRFNVAVTRSKALLITVGNGNVLKQDPNWKRLLDHCSANDSVIGNGLDLSDSFDMSADNVFRSNVNDIDDSNEIIEFSFDNI